MIPPAIKAVFFDAVGTLLLPARSVWAVYAETGRCYGSRLTESQIADRFRAVFRAEEEADWAAGLRTSEARERRRWRDIVGRVLDDASDPAACFAELFEHFARPENWRCAAGAAEVMAALEGRGLLLGMGSNYDDRLDRVLAGLPELARLRRVVISSRVGWRKPARGFFEAMRAAAGVAAGEVFYVGDDLVNDYQGAMAAGMGAVLFDPAGRGPAGVRRVRHLPELLPAPAGP